MPVSFEMALTEKEYLALQKLAKQQDMSPAAVMKQALRTYQLIAVGHAKLVDTSPLSKAPPQEVRCTEGGDDHKPDYDGPWCADCGKSLVKLNG